MMGDEGVEESKVEVGVGGSNIWDDGVFDLARVVVPIGFPLI